MCVYVCVCTRVCVGFYELTLPGPNKINMNYDNLVSNSSLVAIVEVMKA